MITLARTELLRVNSLHLHGPIPSPGSASQRIVRSRSLCTAALLLTSYIAAATEPKSASPSKPAASAPPQSLSSSLGVYAFPTRAQTHEQQNADEAACFGWAKTQTGYDPLRPSVPKTQSATDAAPVSAASGGGERARGALGGAAAGAVIGAVAGDAEDGAKIGAAAGTLRGGQMRRQSAKQAELGRKQAEATAAERTDRELAAAKEDYNRAFGACLEGKGYSVK